MMNLPAQIASPAQPTGFEQFASARAELQLLMCLARVHLAPHGIERAARLLQHSMDWDFLVRWGAAHGVLPLLCWHLKSTLLTFIPPQIREHLQHHFHGNICHNLSLTGELLHLLKLFEAHGIHAIPYKGPALAVAAYGSLALRTFGDLDLLLRQTDIPHARELMLACGYRPAFALSPNQEKAYLASICELPLVHEKNGVLVELHSQVTPKAFAFPLDPEPLWHKLAPLSLNGTRVLALRPEDSLLILCAHGSKHQWTRLGWICDIAEMLRSYPNMNFSVVMEQARRLHSERMLLLGLLLAHELLQAPVPMDLVHKARLEPCLDRLAACIYRRMFHGAEDQPGGLDGALFYLQIRERPRDGLRYFLSMVLTPTLADWQLFSLPRPLFFLYYFIRACRLAAKYGQRLFGAGRFLFLPRHIADHNL